MRAPFPLLALVFAAAAAHASACGDSGASDDGNLDGGAGAPTLPDTGVGFDDARAPAATMRLAHVAPGLGPVDFCYRSATTSSFEGPVLGGGGPGPRADAGDAEAGDGLDLEEDAGDLDASEGGVEIRAVAYRSVSRYLTLAAAGPLTIALVPAGASSCASLIFSADVTLDPGKLATVAIMGSRDADGGESALGLAGFVDDRATEPDKSRVRIVHAATGTASRAASPAIAVRAVGAKVVPVAERVEPRKASSASSTVPVDSLGYATITPVPSPAQLAVGPAPDTSADGAADSWMSLPGELGLRGAALHTGFVLTADDQSFEILWCTDTSTSGERTTCQLVR
ncbi:MAG: DUF4397 domain-containing protein [Labilithrix sp.]|nr:DUF4397 domain-containing protein [Labilithrix sp.]